MKKKSTAKSAFFNLRILTASALCLLGIAVGLFAQGNHTKARQNNQSNRSQDAPGTQRPDVVKMVGPVRLNSDLRDLPWVAPKAEHEDQPLYRHPRVENPAQTSATSAIAGLPHVQSLLQNISQPMPNMVTSAKPLARPLSGSPPGKMHSVAVARTERSIRASVLLSNCLPYQSNTMLHRKVDEDASSTICRERSD